MNQFNFLEIILSTKYKNINPSVKIVITNMMYSRNARMAFGGMDATTKMATVTASSLIGETWCPQTIEKGIDTLTKEMKLPPEAPGAMVRFRQTLAISFLFKVSRIRSNMKM